MTATGEAVRLYTVKEAAEILHIGVDYVYDRINDGTLTATDLGLDVRPKRRIRADVLQAFIDSRTG